MLVSDAGLELIKQFEGCSLTKYLCVAGYPTIGYGHVLQPGDSQDPITQDQADALLREDVHKFERAVAKLTPRALNQGQFDALVSFTFNLGAAAYQRSTLRQMVIAGHDDMVPYQFLRWVRAGGMVRAGLVRRRAAEAHLYGKEDAHGEA